MKWDIRKSVPNLITIFRIISLILGFALFIKDYRYLSIALYILGSISDAFDGYFARKWNAYSKFGAYLDAISDKFYALSIIILSVVNKNYFILFVCFFELLIAFINLLIVLKKENVGTKRVGKFKTAILFITLLISLLQIIVPNLIYPFSIFLILTVYFQIQCIFAYINQLHGISSDLEVDYRGKSLVEKAKLLLYEFKYYLFHPVKIVNRRLKND